MRPMTSFTLHAMLAAAIAALATASAAAQAAPQATVPAPAPAPPKTTLDLGSGAGSSPQAAKGDKPRLAVLEVQSFKWGTAADIADLGSWAKAEGLEVNWDSGHRAVNKVDSFAIKQKPLEAVGSSETITTHANRTESGLPTGKRMHKPFTLARPLEKGSVWIRVASPWDECRVGKRYPSFALTDGVTTYRLQGVTTSGCGRSGTAAGAPAEEVAFFYNKLSF